MTAAVTDWPVVMLTNADGDVAPGTYYISHKTDTPYTGSGRTAITIRPHNDKVEAEWGTTDYSIGEGSLSTAISYANTVTNGTAQIRLLDNATLPVGTKIVASLELDLNGFSISPSGGSGSYLLQNDCQRKTIVITIADSSPSQSGVIDGKSKGVITMSSGDELIIQGGSLVSQTFNYLIYSAKNVRVEAGSCTDQTVVRLIIP